MPGLMETSLRYDDDLLAFIERAPIHEIRVLAGLDAEVLSGQLALSTDVKRPVFYLDFDPQHRSASVATLIERAIAGMARFVLQLWPFLWDGEDFSEARDDALNRLYLPIKLQSLIGKVPNFSQSWARAAVSELLKGCLPRVQCAAPEVEFAQLCRAVSPAGFVLVTSLDAEFKSEIFVRVLEWMAATADIAVVILVKLMPPAESPYERILFGAKAFADRRESALLACKIPGGVSTIFPEGEAPTVLALPEVVGRPHPLSIVEQKIAKLLERDKELQFLFSHNQFILDASGPRAKVDLLWSEGRVIVEFDGDEHWRQKYRADRHRDYELLCAGYLVLRITNAEVLEDAARTIEKIRDVVRLRIRSGEVSE